MTANNNLGNKNSYYITKFKTRRLWAPPRWGGGGGEEIIDPWLGIGVPLRVSYPDPV